MKSTLISASLLLIANVACQRTNDTVAPTVDQRDQQVGVYACEVTVKNFTTQVVSATYLDTLEVSKQSDYQLLVRSYKNTQFPVLESLDKRGLSYAGIFTNLNFNQGQLQLSTGPDITFYSYKGRKLN